jgi:hypothetical protein
MSEERNKNDEGPIGDDGHGNEPIDNEHLVWATVHVMHAAGRIVDFLSQCGDCHTCDGLPACDECEEATGALFALNMIASSLECNQKGHRAIRRAGRRLMDKRVAALESRIEAAKQSRPYPLSLVTFSAN